MWVYGKGNLQVIVISLRQLYPGHVKQAATLASTLSTGIAIAGKFVVVVDDVDPSDWDEVFWALATRCDPGRGVQVITGMHTTPLEPTIPPERRPGATTLWAGR